MVGAFSLGLLAQISFIAHQVAFLEPTLGLKGAGWAVSVTALSALVGRLAVGLVIDRVDRRGASAAVLCVQVSVDDRAAVEPVGCSASISAASCSASASAT